MQAKFQQVNKNLITENMVYLFITAFQTETDSFDN